MTVLTRLTAGSPTKDPREGPGGYNALTEADINFAVSTLPPMDAAILLASHIDQPPPNNQLLNILTHLENKMRDEWKRQGLGGCRLEKLETMAEIAWAEFCTGERLTEEQKALECDMHRNSWLDKYRRVYPAATGELSSIERRSYGRVKKALK